MTLQLKNILVIRESFRLEISRVDIAAGKICGVQGRSGSGKSTLLHAIAGFLPLASGQIVLGDRELSGLPPEQRKVALVFQNGALFPHLTVFENVEFGLRVAGVPSSERQSKVSHWLTRLEIGELADRFPAQISGGQAQRVALARALIVQFPILLLDEPFTGLDDSLRSQSRQLIKQLVHEQKLYTLVVSHDKEDLESLADFVIELERGQLRRL